MQAKRTGYAFKSDAVPVERNADARPKLAQAETFEPALSAKSGKAWPFAPISHAPKEAFIRVIHSLKGVPLQGDWDMRSIRVAAPPFCERLCLVNVRALDLCLSICIDPLLQCGVI